MCETPVRLLLLLLCCACSYVLYTVEYTLLSYWYYCPVRVAIYLIAFARILTHICTHTHRHSIRIRVRRALSCRCCCVRGILCEKWWAPWNGDCDRASHSWCALPAVVEKHLRANANYIYIVHIIIYVMYLFESETLHSSDYCLRFMLLLLLLCPARMQSCGPHNMNVCALAAKSRRHHDNAAARRQHRRDANAQSHAVDACWWMYSRHRAARRCWCARINAHPLNVW